ncbi:hypothetical protein N8Z26_04480 [Burkholderiales bacterium]|nr:hypothetical protein [Burkholderiales bacterium]
MTSFASIGLCVFLTIILLGCGEKSDDASSEALDESGIFLQILLEDEKGQEISYVLFNPNVKTLDACNASAETSLDDIVNRLPPEYSASEVTGWSCSLTNPEAGKTKIDRIDA